MAKALLHTDSHNFNLFKLDINKYVQAINELSTAYEALGVGKFSKDIFLELTSGDFSRVEQTLMKGCDKNPILKALTANGVKEWVIDFKARINALERSRPYLQSIYAGKSRRMSNSEIEFEGNIAVVTDSFLTRIEETTFKHFADTDFENEALRKLQSVERLFNQTTAFFKENGFRGSLMGPVIYLDNQNQLRINTRIFKSVTLMLENNRFENNKN